MRRNYQHATLMHVSLQPHQQHCNVVALNAVCEKTQMEITAHPQPAVAHKQLVPLQEKVYFVLIGNVVAAERLSVVRTVLSFNAPARCCAPSVPMKRSSAVRMVLPFNAYARCCAPSAPM
jgi:hypothetical protein